MSEPMSNHEIEDVLSSIRRLVSEDLRPAPRSGTIMPDAPAATPEARPAPEKLILTPAFRVVDAPAATAPESVMPETAMSEDFAAAQPVPEAGDVVSRLSAAMDDSPADWESPEGDQMAWDEAPVQAAPKQTEPNQTPGPDPMAGRLHFSPMPDDRRADDDLAGQLGSDPADLWTAPVEDDAFAEVEELDTTQPPPRRVVSPPGDAGWADAAEAEVRAELDRETEEVGASMFDTQDVTFDEEVLRDLVRDIIREELAGTLGERITRNVRKLVRAEIARALAVREFE